MEQEIWVLQLGKPPTLSHKGSTDANKESRPVYIDRKLGVNICSADFDAVIARNTNF